MSGYNSDDDLLGGPQRDLSGFLVPETSPGFTSPGTAAAVGFTSPGTAASVGFTSPGTAAAVGFTSPGSTSSQKKRPPCPHGLRKDTCKTCWQQYNDDRVLKGLAPEARGIFCKHGINKFTTHPCRNPECMEQRKVPFDLQFTPTGVIPENARMFEPPVPNSAGLSFSELQASEVKPLHKKLFDDDDEKMSGGSKISRKSYKKTVRKSKKNKSRRIIYRKSKKSLRK